MDIAEYTSDGKKLSTPSKTRVKGGSTKKGSKPVNVALNTKLYDKLAQDCEGRCCSIPDRIRQLVSDDLAH